ncbi:MAG TPA: NAD-dependent epimerase/dehydratase family protein [Patescibacteria group bacterium]|nr:NAD-dependent epimerase/dehydratase family protein [Patescibacteria group bacterium]
MAKQIKKTRKKVKKMKRTTFVCHNKNKTCWNCPAAIFKGNVDFRACGQEKKVESLREDGQIVIECSRRPKLGHYEPNITFEQCPEWEKTKYGYLLKNMRVMILGIDGYLGWTLALKLGKLGFQVSGIDNYTRRDSVMERCAHTIVPIARMTKRLKTARKVLGIDINFRKMDICDIENLKIFLEEEKPEAIVHYAEIPSAPYSMIDVDHAIQVQKNNVIGTLGLLWTMKDIVPNASLIKLGTLGEYGAPLTGRPLFEGMFPADAILKWDNREWSLGGELTPRDPVSLYHVSKVQDTFNVYEACKYWWLRSYDVMQGVIYGVHTQEVSANPKLRTRLDIDEWFGTVVNRFVAQVILGLPLTIYGSGSQIRGMIALEDAMECMVRLIASPPEPGQYAVVNQISGLHKISELAETIAEVGRKKFGLKAKIQRLENPRVETEEHPFEVVSRNLPQLGFKPKVSLEKEITRMFKLLTKREIKERIKAKAQLVWPKTRWSGEKRKSEVLEIYKPGTKKVKGYKGKLDI